MRISEVSVYVMVFSHLKPFLPFYGCFGGNAKWFHYMPDLLVPLFIALEYEHDRVAVCQGKGGELLIVFSLDFTDYRKPIALRRKL